MDLPPQFRSGWRAQFLRLASSSHNTRLHGSSTDGDPRSPEFSAPAVSHKGDFQDPTFNGELLCNVACAENGGISCAKPKPWENRPIAIYMILRVSALRKYRPKKAYKEYLAGEDRCDFAITRGRVIYARLIMRYY